MNLILEALKLLIAGRKLKKECMVKELKLVSDAAGLVLNEIINVEFVPGLVIKVNRAVCSGLGFNLDQVQVSSKIQVVDLEGIFYANSQKTQSRQYYHLKEHGNRQVVTKEYSTRKKSGPKPSFSDYPKTEIDRILKSSTYTENEEKEQSRLELLLKRKSVYRGTPTKNKKEKTVQGSILGFFKRK